MIFAPWCFGVLVFRDFVFLSRITCSSSNFNIHSKRRFNIFEITATLWPKRRENFFLLFRNLIFLPLKVTAPLPISIGFNIGKLSLNVNVYCYLLNATKYPLHGSWHVNLRDSPLVELSRNTPTHPYAQVHTHTHTHSRSRSAEKGTSQRR